MKRTTENVLQAIDSRQNIQIILGAHVHEIVHTTHKKLIDY